MSVIPKVVSTLSTDKDVEVADSTQVAQGFTPTRDSINPNQGNDFGDDFTALDVQVQKQEDGGLYFETTDRQGSTANAADTEVVIRDPNEPGNIRDNGMGYEMGVDWNLVDFGQTYTSSSGSTNPGGGIEGMVSMTEPTFVPKETVPATQDNYVVNNQAEIDDMSKPKASFDDWIQQVQNQIENVTIEFWEATVEGFQYGKSETGNSQNVGATQDQQESVSEFAWSTHNIDSNDKFTRNLISFKDAQLQSGSNVLFSPIEVLMTNNSLVAVSDGNTLNELLFASGAGSQAKAVETLKTYAKKYSNNYSSHSGSGLRASTKIWDTQNSKNMFRRDFVSMFSGVLGYSLDYIGKDGSTEVMKWSQSVNGASKYIPTDSVKDSIDSSGDFVIHSTMSVQDLWSSDISVLGILESEFNSKYQNKSGITFTDNDSMSTAEKYKYFVLDVPNGIVYEKNDTKVYGIPMVSGYLFLIEGTQDMYNFESLVSKAIKSNKTSFKIAIPEVSIVDGLTSQDSEDIYTASNVSRIFIKDMGQVGTMLVETADSDQIGHFAYPAFFNVMQLSAGGINNSGLAKSDVVLEDHSDIIKCDKIFGFAYTTVGIDKSILAGSASNTIIDDIILQGVVNVIK